MASIDLHSKDLRAYDTVLAPPLVEDSTKWNDKSVRTEPFQLHSSDTVRLWRYFSLDNTLDDPDTASLKTALTDSSDYIKARIYLRRLSDSSSIAILDTAIIKKSGYHRSGTDDDIQTVYVAPHGFVTDSVFITLEMTRGDSLNGFTISSNDIYGRADITDSTISFKKSSQTMNRQTAAVIPGSIQVSVIPNPFHTSAKVSIDAPKDIPLNVTLFDELGRKVSELANGSGMQSHSEYTLTSQTLSTGFYYLRVQSGGEVVTRKVQLLK